MKWSQKVQVEVSNMQIKIVVLSMVAVTSFIYADTAMDQDFDGVPDTIDRCKDTPFLNEVNELGCTTTILTLPSETESKSLIVKFGYGYSRNDDLVGREFQRNTKLQLSYYENSWSYSLLTGYYSHSIKKGFLDTTLKIKKRIRLNSEFVLALGGGLRFPTHHFKGNKTDTILYHSLHYYPTASLSFFTGYNYTNVGDGIYRKPLQNTDSFYIGAGYFFTPDLYTNLSYTKTESKFRDEHVLKSISGTLYYKINEKWFTTVYYKRDFDEDTHDSFIIKLGYKIW